MFKCPLCESEFEKTNILARHWRKIHNEEVGKLYRMLYNVTDKEIDEKRYCKCGCGKEVAIEYVKGHYSRVHNNWGHNQKALQNSLNKRLEMLEDGIWKPFCLKETGEHWHLV